MANKPKHAEKVKEEKATERIRAKKAKPITLIDKKCCRGCMYYSTDVHCCQYILVTGHCRPCKGGVGCTAKVLGKSPRKWAVDV